MTCCRLQSLQRSTWQRQHLNAFPMPSFTNFAFTFTPTSIEKALKMTRMRKPMTSLCYSSDSCRLTEQISIRRAIIALLATALRRCSISSSFKLPSLSFKVNYPSPAYSFDLMNFARREII